LHDEANNFMPFGYENEINQLEPEQIKTLFWRCDERSKWTPDSFYGTKQEAG